jgi:hypothetical protein
MPAAQVRNRDAQEVISQNPGETRIFCTPSLLNPIRSHWAVTRGLTRRSIFVVRGWIAGAKARSRASSTRYARQ